MYCFIFCLIRTPMSVDLGWQDVCTRRVITAMSSYMDAHQPTASSFLRCRVCVLSSLLICHSLTTVCAVFSLSMCSFVKFAVCVLHLYWQTPCRVERCWTDDLMPNVRISYFPPSSVDPEVHGLKVIMDCPQPGSSQATCRPPPLDRWSKCSDNDMMMVLLGGGYEQDAQRNSAVVTT